MYRLFLKRFFDIILSFLALLILPPVFIVLAILIRIKLGSPVIFKQKRVGKNCKIFTMYKFRTMTNKKDSEGNLLPDEERLTKFGKILRASSLDELPELWNILKGDMSIIGPRPLLVDFLPFYSEEQNKRHNVRPGLTGYAQVNGRNKITWQRKFELDVQYVNNITILKDTAIFFKTFKTVLFREGITPGNKATMETFKFTGNDTENNSSDLYLNNSENEIKLYNDNLTLENYNECSEEENNTKNETKLYNDNLTLNNDNECKDKINNSENEIIKKSKFKEADKSQVV